MQLTLLTSRCEISLLKSWFYGVGPSSNVPSSASAVQIDMPPPSTIQPSQTVNISASVSYNTGGVTWSCSPAGACGTFNPATTGNEVVTSYVAPSSATSGTAIFTIAASVTDINKSASAGTLIYPMASNTTLSGQYAFFLTSPTGNRGTAVLFGSINLSGDETVADGVADIISPGVLDLHDQILPTSANPQPNISSYTVDATGRYFRIPRRSPKNRRPLYPFQDGRMPEMDGCKPMSDKKPR